MVSKKTGRGGQLPGRAGSQDTQVAFPSLSPNSQPKVPQHLPTTLPPLPYL